eukprot:jgi/Ulvmu1/4966/UM207_0010.1
MQATTLPPAAAVRLTKFTFNHMGCFYHVRRVEASPNCELPGSALGSRPLCEDAGTAVPAANRSRRRKIKLMFDEPAAEPHCNQDRMPHTVSIVQGMQFMCHTVARPPKPHNSPRSSSVQVKFISAAHSEDWVAAAGLARSFVTMEGNHVCPC